jgi:hypothetical protein
VPGTRAKPFGAPGGGFRLVQLNLMRELPVVVSSDEIAVAVVSRMFCEIARFCHRISGSGHEAAFR